MSNEIINFLSKYIKLSATEKKILSEQTVIQAYQKGTILLSEGQFAKECYFVLTGCVYSYYLKEGHTIVTEFYTEKEPITPISYTNKKPSEYFIKCLEDCIISKGSPKSNAALFSKLPRLATIAPALMEDMVVKQKLKHDDLLKLSPEERYSKLRIESSDILGRVPQYLIASYLGIKPESLSRIRKKIMIS